MSKTLVCGREGSHLVFPSDDLMSKKHCRFSLKDGFAYVEDLRSKNRTKVNSLALTPGHPRRLQLNDVVEFGSHRFILTHQNKFAPANIQDSFTQQIFKVSERTNGSLTSRVTGPIRQVTRLLLNRRAYQNLMISEFSRARGWDLSTYLVVFSFPAGAIGIWLLLHLRMQEIAELPYSSSEVFLRLLGTSAIFSAIFGLWHYLTVRRRFSAMKRVLFIPLWFGISLMLLPFFNYLTKVLTVPSGNWLVSECLRAGSDKPKDACTEADFDSFGFRGLPRGFQDRIRSVVNN